MKYEIKSDLSFGGPCFFFSFFLILSFLKIKGSLALSLFEIISEEKTHPQSGLGNPIPCPVPKIKNMNTFSNNSESIFISYLPYEWKFKVMIFLDICTWV